MAHNGMVRPAPASSASDGGYAHARPDHTSGHHPHRATALTTDGLPGVTRLITNLLHLTSFDRRARSLSMRGWGRAITPSRERSPIRLRDERGYTRERIER